MSKIGLIIGREYSTRVKKKAFIVLTILVPILVVSLMFLAIWLGMEEKKHVKVLISDPRNLCNATIDTLGDTDPPASFYFTPTILTPLISRTGKISRNMMS